MTAAVGLSAAARAAACPYCESEIGREVAARVFGPDFWANAAATLAPLPALLLAVALVRRLGKPR